MFNELSSSNSGVFFNNTSVYNNALSVLEFEYMYNGAGVAVADFATESPGELKNKIHEKRVSDWKFFATDKKMALKGFGDLTWLKLPSDVVDKIYMKNAQNFLLWE